MPRKVRGVIPWAERGLWVGEIVIESSSPQSASRGTRSESRLLGAERGAWLGGCAGGNAPSAQHPPRGVQGAPTAAGRSSVVYVERRCGSTPREGAPRPTLRAREASADDRHIHTTQQQGRSTVLPKLTALTAHPAPCSREQRARAQRICWGMRQQPVLDALAIPTIAIHIRII
eukprot:scaffold15922_cov111-Isochrysis_galbana.AAC.7